MNRESCGYLVRALNQLATLTARCSFDEVDRPVEPNAPRRIEGCRRKSAQRRRSRYRNRHARSKIDRVNTASLI